MPLHKSRTVPVLMVCAALLGLSASAGAETVVRVPAGTYTFAEVVTRSGTADNWVRYTPATPGTVTFRGGFLLNVHYVILDGFRVEGRLDPEWPTKSRGINIRNSTNVTVTRTEVIGPADIHTGFHINGQRNCSEATDYPTASAGIASVETKNITFEDIVVHGFYGSGTMQGQHDTITRSLLRNSHNGLDVSSDTFVMTDSVMWVHPNHMFSVKGQGTWILENNLFVDSQDMLQAGKGWEGARHVTLRHNTYYIPANKPCYGFTGINTYSIKEKALIRDNILVNKSDGFINTGDVSIRIVESDYNMFYNHVATTREFSLIDKDVKISFETWKSMTGNDDHSIVRQEPEFANPPQYEDFSANKWGFRIPSSVAEARSWFALKSGSPGKGSASDRLDIGINGSILATQQGPSAPQGLRVVP